MAGQVARKTSRRNFLKIVGTTTGGILLTACAAPAGAPAAVAPTSATTASGEAAPTEAAAAVANTTPTTLYTNAPYLGAPGFEEIAKEYRRVLDAAGLDWVKYEYQQADTTALETRMAGGDAPDLIYVYPELAQPWAARGQLISLTNSITADPVWKKDVDTFIKSMNDGYTYNGELYALTTAAEAECIAYNPNIFKEKGVQTPAEIGKDAFNFDAFTSMVDAVSGDKAKGFFAMGEFNQSMGDFVHGFGGSYFSADGKTALLNSPEFISAVELQVNLVKKGSALNGIQSNKDGQWVAAALANQLVASVIAGDWAWGWAHKTQLEKKEFQPEMFYIPAGPKGRHPIAHSAGLAIFAQSKSKDAALAYIKLGFTKEFQEVAAKMYEVSPQFPARLDASGPIFEKKLLPDFFVDLFEGSLPSPATPVFNPYPVFGYMYDMWDAVFKGKDTRPIKEVQDEMNARVQKDMDAAATSLP